MKVLIVTPHFYPEQFKCNSMAFELARRGYDVEVMTAIPDYPEGKFYKGYGFFQRRCEVVNGVRIHRSPIIPRGNGNKLSLMLNYASYTFFASIEALWKGLTHHYDVILVHETSPVMVGIPAVIIKKIQHIPLHFWVLDLWPESVSAAGGINNRHILSVLRSMTRWIYNHCDTLLIGSKGFRKFINQMGDFDQKIQFFPNWIEETTETPLTVPLPSLPEGFNVVFTGNLGDAQDMPAILDTAERLQDTKINIVLIGDGRRRKWIEEQKQERHLHNVFCLGRFPFSAMPHFYVQADALLLSLKDNPIFALTVPAKLQAYMASGKPIVAMINGEGANTIADADCGYSVPAGDATALANLLQVLSEKPTEELTAKGLNGKSYAHKFYDFQQCINNLTALFPLDHETR